MQMLSWQPYTPIEVEYRILFTGFWLGFAALATFY